MTNAMVVTEVNTASISHMKLLIGDVISSVNGQKIESRTHFAELYGKISQLGATFNIDVVMQRPLVSIPIKPAQIPPGYEVVTGCKYHVGVMYRVSIFFNNVNISQVIQLIFRFLVASWA